MKEPSPVVRYLREHWEQEFKLEELVKLGFGTIDQVHYALNSSRYVTKVKRGIYKFSAWYIANALTCREGVLEHLKKHPKSSVEDLAKATRCSIQTVRKSLTQLEQEHGHKIKSERVYSLGE